MENKKFTLVQDTKMVRTFDFIDLGYGYFAYLVEDVVTVTRSRTCAETELNGEQCQQSTSKKAKKRIQGICTAEQRLKALKGAEAPEFKYWMCLNDAQLRLLAQYGFVTCYNKNPNGYTPKLRKSTELENAFTLDVHKVFSEQWGKTPLTVGAPIFDLIKSGAVSVNDVYLIEGKDHVSTLAGERVPLGMFLPFSNYHLSRRNFDLKGLFEALKKKENFVFATNSKGNPQIDSKEAEDAADFSAIAGLELLEHYDFGEPEPEISFGGFFRLNKDEYTKYREWYCKLPDKLKGEEAGLAILISSGMLDASASIRDRSYMQHLVQQIAELG